MLDLGQIVAERDPPGLLRDRASIAAEAAPDFGVALPRPLIRPFREDDLADVAALFLRLFRRHHRGSRSLDLETCLKDVLFRADRPPAVPPGLVSIGPSGALRGFVACSTQPMRLGGRRLAGLAGGTLMIDPAQRGDATALFRLLRAFFGLPHDVSFTDTASPVSRAVLEQFGATFLPLQSMDWVVLRSRAGLALRLGLDRARITALDRAIGTAVRVRTGWTRQSGAAAPAGRRKPGPHFLSPLIDELAASLIQLAGEYPLHPDWESDPAPLLFRLAEAGKLRRHGPLQARVAIDAAGDPVAVWIAHLRPGGVGRVMQVLARPGHADAALDDCLAVADSQGCVAVRGRLQPDLLPVLARRKVLFAPRLATMIRTSDPALVKECLQAPALLTGLAGETWSRIFEDDFA